MKFFRRCRQSSIFILAGVFIATFVMNLPPILLLCWAEKLGRLWAILLIAYMTLLITAFAKILWSRQMVKLRYDLGDEQFFRAFPRERKKELRRKARQQRARQRRAEREGLLL